LDDVVAICSNEPDRADKAIYGPLINDIKEGMLAAQTGILNLCVTYHDDIDATTRLGNVNKNISKQYIEFETQYTSLQPL
jgi:hypothetical protein